LKIHKVELYIVDHDEVGAHDIEMVMEQVNYPNDCITPHIISIKTAEIDYTDEHPLNYSDGREVEAFNKLFKDIG
jgi:hypothetical protein